MTAYSPGAVPGDRFAVDGLDLEVPAGRRTALVNVIPYNEAGMPGYRTPSPESSFLNWLPVFQLFMALF